MLSRRITFEVVSIKATIASELEASANRKELTIVTEFRKPFDLVKHKDQVGILFAKAGLGKDQIAVAMAYPRNQR